MNFEKLFSTMVSASPQLQSGSVWCRKCGKTGKTDSLNCLRHGWPKCCGETMSLDPPPAKATGEAALEEYLEDTSAGTCNCDRCNRTRALLGKPLLTKADSHE